MSAIKGFLNVVKSAAAGIVNLLNNGRDEAARSISSSGDGRLTPGVDRSSAKRAVRGGRGQMALDVESVVNGGVG